MPSREPGEPTSPSTLPEVQAFVRAEAHRLAAQSRLRADPARVAEGWTRRFVIEGRRVEECVRLYEALGYEVVSDPVCAADVMEDCTDCGLVAQLEFRMIYTRGRR